MAAGQVRVTIIGCGPGGADYLTPAARDAAAQADILIGSARLLALLADSTAQKVALPGDVEATIAQILANPASRVAVLVSGDVGLSSLAQPILRRLGRANCRLIPAVSSVQVAFARLGLDWTHVRIVNAHGRPVGEAAETVTGCETAAILCGTKESLTWAAQAARVLAKSHDAFLCQDLTLPTERVERRTPAQLASAAESASSLSVVVLAKKDLLE